MKRHLAFGAVGFLAIASLAYINLAQGAEISISCGAVGQEQALCKSGVEAWSKKTGNSVKVLSAPSDTNDGLALYQQLLSAGAPDIDVYQIDVIWPGLLGNHFIDLSPYTKGAEKSYFPTLIANDTIDGKLVAMPWYTDVGILYYRTDLLNKYGVKPPQTWAELTEGATKIMDGERKAGNDKMWGMLFQGKAYEGLTCDALEWIDSFGGGTIVDDDGKITINNPKAAQALSVAASWVGKISPEGVLNYSEEDTRGIFQSGNAVFLRSWPYVWSLAQGADSPIKDKIGVVALPKGGENGKNSGTLGGWQLAVSKYSKNPAEAADLVMYLTSPEEQKRRAIVGAYNPTIPVVYDDPEVLKAVPFLGALKTTFFSAVARPSRVTKGNYNKVSSAVWNAVHEVLTGSQTSDVALANLESALKKIKKSQW